MYIAKILRKKPKYQKSVAFCELIWSSMHLCKWRNVGRVPANLAKTAKIWQKKSQMSSGKCIFCNENVTLMPECYKINSKL